MRALEPRRASKMSKHGLDEQWRLCNWCYQDQKEQVQADGPAESIAGEIDMIPVALSVVEEGIRWSIKGPNLTVIVGDRVLGLSWSSSMYNCVTQIYDKYNS